MTAAVMKVTMGAMCECGRGRIPNVLSCCDHCFRDRAARFWAVYDRDARHARQAAKGGAPAKRPGTPGSVRVTRRAAATAARRV